MKHENIFTPGEYSEVPLQLSFFFDLTFHQATNMGMDAFERQKNNYFLFFLVIWKNNNFLFSKSSQPLPAFLPFNSTFPPVKMDEFSIFLPTAFFIAKTSWNKCFSFLTSYYLLNTLQSVYRHLHLVLPRGHLSIFIFLNLWAASDIFLFLTFIIPIFFCSLSFSGFFDYSFSSSYLQILECPMTKSRVSSSLLSTFFHVTSSRLHMLIPSLC